MNYIKLVAPGSWCTHQAFKDIITKFTPTAKTFVDVGCGEGELSKELLSMSLKGTGVDFSSGAIELAGSNLRQSIHEHCYELILKDVTRASDLPQQSYDVGVCNMVMEHIEDDVAFARRCVELIKPCGYFLFAVPARNQLWSLEDDSVGHYRRYEYDTLKATLEKAGLEQVDVYSVAVPISNWLFGLNKLAIRHFERHNNRAALDQESQTQRSGITEIPWKTIYPEWTKLILNRYSLMPLFLLQRLFYKSKLGHVMIGFGQKAS